MVVSLCVVLVKVLPMQILRTSIKESLYHLTQMERTCSMNFQVEIVFQIHCNSIIIIKETAGVYRSIVPTVLAAVGFHVSWL